MRSEPVDKPSEELAALLAEERKIVARFEEIQIQKAQKRVEIAAAAAVATETGDADPNAGRTYGTINLVTGRRTTDRERVRAYVWRAEAGFEFTTSELATELSIKANSVSAYLSELKADGLIERVGTTRGRYQVVQRADSLPDVVGQVDL